MIYPVVLCGGSGTRLWPLSRREYPKQFTALVGERSLLQATLDRLTGPRFAAPLLLAHADFRFLVMEQAMSAGIAAPEVLLEPEARNTAPAILAAALHLIAEGHGAVPMLVAPSDHAIDDAAAFRAALDAGAAAAAEGRIVTFAIRPDRAETGYGWLEFDAVPDMAPPRAVPVQRFVEKPDTARAEEMLAAGRFFWNAGIFMARPDTLVAAFETHAPDMVAPVRAALDAARRDLDFLRLDPAAWAELREDSIDYAIMEKAPGVVGVPVECGWSDLGAWDAVWQQMAPDGRGVATAGPVTEIDCTDTLLRSVGERGPRLVGVGLTGIAAIAMGDAVLVADKRDSAGVKRAVAAMKAAGVAEAEALPRTHRPWGWYEPIARGARFQVKQIMVPPGRKLSLQSHVHRSEHWVVVAGTARVTIDEDVHLVTENQSVYIPLGAVHRLENPGKVDLHLIEVQTGSYLGEDDIVRYEDTYNRV